MCKDVFSSQKTEPTICIFCSSSDINANTFQVDGFTAHRTVYCDDCEGRWSEVFETNSFTQKCPECLSFNLNCSPLESNDLNVSIENNECLDCGHIWDISYHFKYCEKY